MKASKTNRLILKSNELSEPLYWPMSSTIRPEAINGMNKRALYETALPGASVDISGIHGEALRRYSEIENLVAGALYFLRCIGLTVKGKVADLGSGTGTGACILSKHDCFNIIYAVEYSKDFVQRMMPLVFQQNNAHVDKIQRVVGDFNYLQFDDNTIDLLFENGSFHHSESLEITLRESYRVLRHNGALVAIDRGWPDSTIGHEIQDSLNKELTDEQKKKYGIPLSLKFTRRDWGEHEYTIGQWLNAFQKAGFDAAALVQNAPSIRGVNRILKLLPTYWASLYLGVLFYRRQVRRLQLYGFRPKQVLFICIKRRHSQGNR